MADANNASDHSLLWGYPVEFWDRLGIWSLIVGAGLGVAALLLTAASAYVLYRVADKAQVELASESKKANEEIAKANATAATANRETAGLRLQLEREVQKRAPRQLTENQKSALTETLRGKVQEVTFVVQEDLEAQAFALQIQIAIQEAGAKLFLASLPPGELLTPAPGLVMYSPNGQSEEELKDDPLFLALKKARLFGGTTSKPFASFKVNPAKPGPWPVLPINGYVLYVAQKAPW
jgi:hypothetical protein